MTRFISVAWLLALVTILVTEDKRMISAQDRILEQSAGMLAGWVRDDDGNPLPNVTVVMSIVGRDQTRRWESIEKTKTDADGMYRLQIKEPGFLSMAATGPGWSWTPKQLFEIKVGQRLDSVNFVLTRSARVQVELEDERGRPVEQARLEQLGWSIGDSGMQWLQDKVAKASGLGMPASTEGNKLVIEKVPQHSTLVAWIDCPEFALAIVKLDTDGPQPKKVILSRGAPLQMKLLTVPSQKPLANQDVWIHYFDPENPGLLISRKQTSNEKGYCKFLVNRARDLSVRIENPNYVLPKWNSFSEWGEEPGGKSITLELREKSKVRGRVLEAGTNQPAVNARVDIIITPGEVFTSTVTDANGFYELEGAVGAAQIVPAYDSGYYVEPHATIEVALKAGEIVHAPKDLVLRKIPAIQGTVTENGQPVENAIVFTSMRSPPSVTDSAGRFTLPILSDARHFIEAVHLPSNFSGAASVTREMIGQAQSVNIELKPNSEIRGSIADWNPQAKASKEIYLLRQIFDRGSGTSSNLGASRIDERGEFVFKGLNRSFEYMVSPILLNRDFENSNWLTLDQPIVKLKPLQGLKLAEAGTFEFNDRPIIGSGELACRAWHNSKALSLEQLRGKVVLLHFFNTQQSSCKSDLRLFSALHEGYASQGLVVIGIHSHTGPFEKAVQMAQALDVRYPIAQDDAAGSSAKIFEVGDRFNSFIIDKSGAVRRTNEDMNQLMRQIQRYLEEKS